jgi:hypothetical protein
MYRDCFFRRASARSSGTARRTCVGRVAKSTPAAVARFSRGASVRKQRVARGGTEYSPVAPAFFLETSGSHAGRSSGRCRARGLDKAKVDGCI